LGVGAAVAPGTVTWATLHGSATLVKFNVLPSARK